MKRIEPNFVLRTRAGAGVLAAGLLLLGGASCGSTEGTAAGSASNQNAGGAGGAAGGAGGNDRGDATGGSSGSLPSGAAFQYPSPLDFGRAIAKECDVFVAPTGTLCGGAAGCPVLLDAEISAGGGARGMTLAHGAEGTSYAAFRTNALADQHLCFFTLSATEKKVEVDPFHATADPEWIFPALLSSDEAGNPHFFLSRAPAVAHAIRGAGGWTQEAVSSDTLKEHTLQGVQVSAGGGMSALYAAHPDQPGFGKYWSLRLASGTGVGWKTDVVFDSAGQFEQPYAALAAGENALDVVYWARTVPAESEVFVWSSGMATSLFHESAVIGHAAIAEGNASQPIVSSQSPAGIQVHRKADSSYLLSTVAATSLPKLTGCPDLNSQGCMKKTTCTETGSGAFFDHRLERTSDGKVWLIYADRQVDRDFDLKESCVTQGDPFCSCTRTLRTDRSTASIVVARVGTDPTAGPEPRLRATLGRLGDEATFASAAHGTRLLIALGREVATPTVYRYLMVATDRL